MLYKHIKIKTLMIEILQGCNVNCVHCYNRKNQIIEVMTVNDVIGLIECFNSYGLEEVIITGGEPLLHPDFEMIVSICEKYPELNFEITTNGLLLESKIVVLVEQYKNVGVQISVDASCKETYEKIRGEGNYEKFLIGLGLLTNSSIKKKSCRMAVSKLNYKEVADVYKHSIQNDMYPSFLFVSQCGNAFDNWNELKMSIPEQLNVINQINNMNKKIGYNIPVPSPVSDCSFSRNEERESLAIKPNGDVAVCQLLYDYPVGNVFNSKLADLLTGEKMMKLYHDGNKRNDILRNSEMCISCPIKKGCGLGCIGEALEDGNIYGVDRWCELRKAVAVCNLNGFT